MTDAERSHAESVAQVVDMLCATYDKSISVDRAKVYIMTLRDIAPDLLRAAALRYIERATYPDIPTPGRLRELVAEIVMSESGAVDASDAWGEVMREMRRVGNWRAPVFSHALISQSIQSIGGWQYLSTTENIVADRARFLEAYSSAQRRAVESLVTLPESRRLSQARQSAQIDAGARSNSRSAQTIGDVAARLLASRNDDKETS